MVGGESGTSGAAAVLATAAGVGGSLIERMCRVEMTDHLRAIRKHWWIVLVVSVVSVGLAVLVTARTTPMYASTVTFFVASSADTGTALQADEFAQRRINSYVGVLTSEKMADRIVKERNLPLDATALMKEITAVANVDTVLLTATVVDADHDRSLEIAGAIAHDLGPLVAELDNRGSAKTANVSLNVISGPTLDPKPVTPRTTLNIGLGVLVGLALGIALAIAREITDTTIRSVDELGSAADVAVLASIGLDKRSKASPASTTTDTWSPRAESYRQLRTNLMFSNVGKQMRVIVVTSPMGNDGKSTTAVNLAIVLAETGKPVLLIDADLRRPSIADMLGIEGNAGLTNVLADQVEPEDAIQKWGTGGLRVLPSGTQPPNPSELIGSERMSALMTWLRGQFETIVIDTPPVLPVTDAVVAAALADGVVLVVRQAKTTREQTSRALTTLRAVGVHIAGAVLNMVPIKDRSAGDGYHAYAPVDDALAPHRWRKLRKRKNDRNHKALGS